VINQMPGGNVIEVQVEPSCPYDELARRSLEAAALQVQSLPYSGFETVFRRELVLDLEAAK
jgi:colicin import membrane protein